MNDFFLMRSVVSGHSSAIALHPYAGCRGTPNQYSAEDWWDHTFNDSGGIWHVGGEAFKDSMRFKIDRTNDTRRYLLVTPQSFAAGRRSH
ncbi:MAG: hypothetical protein ACK4KV_14850 [Rhodocyclaceae bacterium]